MNKWLLRKDVMIQQFKKIRFSLRTLLIVTSIVAIPFAVIAWRIRESALRDRLIEKLETKYGATVLPISEGQIEPVNLYLNEFPPISVELLSEIAQRLKVSHFSGGHAIDCKQFEQISRIQGLETLSIELDLKEYDDYSFLKKCSTLRLLNIDIVRTDESNQYFTYRKRLPEGKEFPDASHLLSKVSEIPNLKQLNTSHLHFKNLNLKSGFKELLSFDTYEIDVDEEVVIEDLPQLFSLRLNISKTRPITVKNLPKLDAFKLSENGQKSLTVINCPNVGKKGPTPKELWLD